MKKRYIIAPLLIAVSFSLYGNVEVKVQKASVEAQTQTVQAPENVKQTPALVNIEPVVVNEPTVTPPAKRYTQPAVDEYGTPIPVVEVIDFPADFKRSDGFDNVCITMPDGSWTTAIMSGYTLGPDLYLYKGEIDPASQAPATAVGSRAWCTEHAPVDKN